MYSIHIGLYISGCWKSLQDQIDHQKRRNIVVQINQLVLLSLVSETLTPRVKNLWLRNSTSNVNVSMLPRDEILCMEAISIYIS